MGEILFYITALVTLAAAFGVVASRNIVHAALFLLVSLAGVAGLFVLLYAEFLALVQLLIYGGAITIVILFALMLTRSGEYEASTETRRWPIAAGASIGLFALMVAVFMADADQFNSGERSGVALEKLATDLFVDWAVPFEVASLVLLIALIGAVVIGRTSRDEDETMPSVDETPKDVPKSAQPGRRSTQSRARRRRGA